MRRAPVVVAMALAAVAATAVARAQHTHAPTPKTTAPKPITMDELHRHGGVPPGWTFRLPAGDAAAGREVFGRLECNRCHAAGTDFAVPAPTAGNAAPDLTGMGAHHPAEYFAESIVDPNAVVVAGPGYTGPDGRSTMPEYRDTMTLADLVNVVAYLKSLGGTGTDHAHHHDGAAAAREKTVEGLRVRVAYGEGGQQAHGGRGHLVVRVHDETSGHAVPYLSLQATLHAPGAKPRAVRLAPMLDDAGFHYGADVALPDATQRVVIAIAPSTLRVSGGIARLNRARTVTIAWDD